MEFEKLKEICGDYQHLNYAKGMRPPSNEVNVLIVSQVPSNFLYFALKYMMQMGKDTTTGPQALPPMIPDQHFGTNGQHATNWRSVH